MTVSGPPAPSATGDIARTPFGHVLVYLQEHRLTGSLVLWRTPEDRSPLLQLYAADGQPVAARVQGGARDLMLSLLPLCARTSGPFAFYAGVDLVGRGEGVLQGPIATERVLAASLRGPSRGDVIDAAVDDLGGNLLQLRQGVDLKAFAFTDAELRVVQRLASEALPVAELCRRAQLPAAVTRRLVYLLRLTKAVAVLPASRRAVSGPMTLPAPPTRPSLVSDSRWLNVSLPPVRKKSG